jgi:hypothetical protein
MVTTVEQINIFIVLVSFPFLWQNQLEGRKLYFGSVSEVSVHGIAFFLYSSFGLAVPLHSASWATFFSRCHSMFCNYNPSFAETSILLPGLSQSMLFTVSQPWLKHTSHRLCRHSQVDITRKIIAAVGLMGFYPHSWSIHSPLLISLWKTCLIITLTYMGRNKVLGTNTDMYCVRIFLINNIGSRP